MDTLFDGYIDTIFQLVDKNGDGKVSKKELKEAIKREGSDFAEMLGFKSHEKHNKDRGKHIDEWFKTADENSDGLIDRAEFYRMLQRKASALI